MPNWCENRWRVFFDCDDEERSRFVDECLSTDGNGLHLDFNKIVPMPEVLEGTISPNDPGQPKYKVALPGDAKGAETGVRPATDEERALLKGVGHENWHDWRYANWSVKWPIDPDNHSVEQENWPGSFGSLKLVFLTPWLPPTRIYETIRKNHPDVTISAFYHEPGMELVGYLGAP